MEVIRIVRKTKALALLSIIVAATVFGAVIFSVSATEDGINEEENMRPCWELRNDLLDDLTEEQREILQAMVEENQTEIKENRDEIKSQLQEWGIEIPTPHGPSSFLEGLTEEQKDELETMRQGFHDSVSNKLEEWGVEVPDFDGMRLGRRGPRRFGMFKP